MSMYVATADYKSPDASKVFCDSLRKTGFAVLTHHPINTKLFDEIYAEWQAFFDSAEKENYLYNKDTQDGYFPPSISETAKGFSIKDIKEYFHIYPWGQYPAHVSHKALDLYKQLNTLAEELLGWIEAHTPAEISAQFSIPLNEMAVDSPRTLLRILHYPPLTGQEEKGAVRAAAHEDINLITLLPAATTMGLQVKDANDEWHDVECNPGALVINIGDMLQECSKGYYRSTTHRVVNPEGEAAKVSRLSMPLFLHPRDEVRLSDRHTARSYLLERLEELGVL